MYVVNTHLQSDYKLATSEILRGQQLNQIIEEVLYPISSQNTPILLAGDYNFDLNTIFIGILFELNTFNICKT